MNSKTNVEKVSQEAEGCKAKICHLLGWTDLQYAECQFENGLLYLSSYLHESAWAIDLIKNKRVFWNWWKNHWHLRDKKFLIYAQGDIDRLEFETFYCYLHDGKELATSFRPTAIVLGEAYAVMMGQLIKETV